MGIGEILGTSLLLIFIGILVISTIAELIYVLKPRDCRKCRVQKLGAVPTEREMRNMKVPNRWKRRR